MKKIKLYDTTLRDGCQAENVVFSLADKIAIAEKLDELGIHYIEGGWPGSNPKDIEFFKQIKNVKLNNAKITAFSSTRRAKKKVDEDSNIQTLLKAETSVVTIFGKTWDLHVRDVLNVSLEENLDMIYETLTYFKNRGYEVIYDAEHFFDGFKENQTYAMKTIDVASKIGVSYIVLCDTNGGILPSEIKKIVEEVKLKVKLPLGIHTHNDNDMAVANTVIAVESGVEHVQGTINGYGERCGNADLCSVIPNLKLKLGIDCISDSQLKKIVYVSRFVSELANLLQRGNQPYVGISAFAHKGGMHVDAVNKNPKTFEHIDPTKVGNKRRILVSELSGVSNILHKAKEFNIDLTKESPNTKEILNKIKELEYSGYQFEGADASLELLINKTLKKHKTFFNLEGFRVIVEKREEKGRLISEATIKLRVNGIFEHTASEGNGPVNALDNALRKALLDFYPSLKNVKLVDYKVRVLDAGAGTSAKVRVLIESTDGVDLWGTVGVSENIIEASWEALVDSIEYKLLKDEK